MILNIVPGYECNLKCSHCVSRSGPDRKESSLSHEELSDLKATISKTPPNTLLISGGEPTLYTDMINDITSAHPNRNTLSVSITTNGIFAITLDSAKTTLLRIENLKTVHMSYDIFHHSNRLDQNLINLKNACKELSMTFYVSISYSDPMELAQAKLLVERFDVDVIYQKSIQVGRATDTKSYFQYYKFDKTVLSEKCPNKGGLSYIKGKGFTSCCSSLIFNKNTFKDTAHSSLQEHIHSSFYENITQLTLGELAEKKKVDVRNLSPEFSSPCRICEYIFLNGTT